MRVIHLSWEYPPTVYGGLGRHVQALAEAQAALGHDVTVITQHAADAPAREVRAGVQVVRAPAQPPRMSLDHDHLLTWVLAMEHSIVRAALPVVGATSESSGPTIVHAHDWLVAHVAATVRDVPGTRLIATIHATEAGRHQGWLPTEVSRSIHAIEGWLVHSADRVIACSEHMCWEVTHLFDLPRERVDVIANGIDLDAWRAAPEEVARARERYGSPGPLVVFCGRLEWEKGVHTLLDAIPRLRRRFPGLQVVVAGRGTRSDALQEQARTRRVSGSASFPGWLPEADLHALMAASDVVVVPSIYEPFGLVALEGAALGAPLAVARSGGLAEFVVEGETGRTFAPGDPADLADAITRSLRDPQESAALAAAARERLRSNHSWSRLAEATIETYRRAERAPESATAAPPVPVNLTNLLAR